MASEEVKQASDMLLMESMRRTGSPMLAIQSLALAIGKISSAPFLRDKNERVQFIEQTRDIQRQILAVVRESKHSMGSAFMAMSFVINFMAMDEEEIKNIVEQETKKQSVADNVVNLFGGQQVANTPIDKADEATIIEILERILNSRPKQ